MKQLTPEQVAKLRPESRERYEQRLKAVKRNRKILAIFCAVVVAVLIIVGLSTTVLFNISDIKVAKTGVNYTANEIISASGLNKGDNIIRTDFEKVSQRIEKNLPYVKEAVITKKLSGTVTITVKDAAAAIFIEAKQGYAVADINGKVLEILEEIPEDAGFMVIRTNNELEAVPGELFGFADEQEKALYDKLVAQLKNVGLFEGVTAVDISDVTSVKVEYQNRLRLLLGTTDDLETKLKGAAETIEMENSKDPNTIAEVNLTIPKKVFVNPVETLHPEEENEVTETPDEGEEATEESSTQQSEESTENVTEPTSEADGDNSDSE